MANLTHLWFSAQGLFLVLAGVYNMLDPEAMSGRGAVFYGTPKAVHHMVSMSCISFGTLYLMAARHSKALLRSYVGVAVPIRLATAYLFWHDGAEWKNMAMLEGGSALINAILLMW